MKLTIVSRTSALALRQTDIVKDALLLHKPNLEINVVAISTQGDEILDQSLMKIGGKGLFVKELERYLLDGKADLAVHSMKDMPAVLHDDLALGAILKRADPRDVFVSIDYPDIANLPVGATVGTSSLRRQAQILALRNDLQVVSLRGNVQTRVSKLVAGEYDAIVLAAAGLQRLGIGDHIKSFFTLDEMLPAVGQGALGVEYLTENVQLLDLLQPISDLATTVCVGAERAMNKILDAGCQAPVAGYARLDNNVLHLQGLVTSVDGKVMCRAYHSADMHEFQAIGTHVAHKLLDQGAGDLIAKAKALWA